VLLDEGDARVLAHLAIIDGHGTDDTSGPGARAGAVPFGSSQLGWAAI